MSKRRPFPSFPIGAWVSWTSQRRPKFGRILVVVPPYTLPPRLPLDHERQFSGVQPRQHESYLVEVRLPGHKPLLYWPHARQLHPAEEQSTASDQQRAVSQRLLAPQESHTDGAVLAADCPPCRHCRLRPGPRARGLCTICYNRKSIRQLYPPDHPIPEGVGTKAPGPGKQVPSVPDERTMPGTAERAGVYAGRVAAGEGIWCRADRRWSLT